MATIADLNIRISASIDDFEAKMARVQSGIGRVGDFAKSAGASLTTFVTLPLTLLAGASIAALAKIDGLTRGLNAISTIDLGKQGVTGLDAVAGAAAATSERLKLLQEIARAPGIGFEQAVQGDIRLRAVGIAAGQSAAVLKEFANAIALTGGGAAKLDEVTVQLAQLSAKGKVLAQDLRPIIEAAPAVATALQKLYGTVDSETISKSLEKQGKSSKDFITTVTDELSKLPRVTGGIGNSLDNFAQGATQSLAKLGDSLNKAFNIDANVNRLSDFLTGLADSFAALDPGVQKLLFGFGAAAAVAGPLLFGLGAIAAAIPSVVAGFQLMGITSVAAFGPIGIAVAAIAAAAVLIYQNWDRVSPLFTDIGLTLSGVATSLRQTFAGLGDALSSVGLTSTNLGTALKALGGFVVDLLVAPFRILAGVLDLVVGQARILIGVLTLDFAGAGKGVTQMLDGLKLALFGIHKETKTTFDAFFGLTAQLIAMDVAAGENAVQGGNIAASLENVGKKAELTKKELKALEDQLKALQKLNEGYDQQASRSVLKVLDTPEFKVNLPTTAALPTTLQTLPGFDTTALAASSAAARQAYQQLTDSQKAAYQGTLDFNVGLEGAIDQLSKSIGPLLADFAGQFGDAFASIVVGTATAGNAMAVLFGGILQSIGSFMSTFGKQLVALDIGKLGLDTLFKGPAGGPLAIAAGLGLIALGSIASAVGSSAASSVSSIGSGGGGSSSLASSPRSSFTPTTAPVAATGAGGTTKNIHNVVFELSGNKLVGLIDIETDRLGRIIGQRR